MLEDTAILTDGKMGGPRGRLRFRRHDFAYGPGFIRAVTAFDCHLKNTWRAKMGRTVQRLACRAFTPLLHKTLPVYFGRCS